MAISLNGSTQYLELASAPASVLPITLACRFRAASIASAYGIMSLEVDGGDTRLSLLAAGNIGGDPVRAQSVVSATQANADSTAGYLANTWHHACGVFTSSTSRAAFIDGGSKGTNATSSSPSGMNRLRIGVRSATTLGLYLSGQVAEVGVWTAALTDDEVRALGLGISPRLVRPNSLVFYAPLIREVRDLARGGTVSNVNGGTVFAHPRRLA